MSSHDHDDHQSITDIEKGLVEYVRKATASPFLVKTYTVVDDPATDDVVSWNADGTAFVVWQTAEFSRDLLPTLFKHSNFSSFIRQLNTYGFRKVATRRWEFGNEMFRKGQIDQLSEIRRRRGAWSNKPPHSVQLETAAPPKNVLENQRRSDQEDQRSSSTSSSSEYTSLVCENKRLKQVNGVLSFELRIAKKKCKELVELVADICGENSDKKEEEKDKKSERGPMLFGVRLREVQS